MADSKKIRDAKMKSKKGKMAIKKLDRDMNTLQLRIIKDKKRVKIGESQIKDLKATRKKWKKVVDFNDNLIKKAIKFINR